MSNPPIHHNELVHHSAEGYGGRSSRSQEWDSARLLAGVLTSDAYPKAETLPEQECANPRCGKLFYPRAEGDIYCSELCDVDNNPQYKGSKE